MLHIKKAMITTAVAATMLVGLVGCQHTVTAQQPAVQTMPILIEGELTQLVISPQKRACPSKLPMQCILVTRVNTNESVLLPYNAIKGLIPKKDVGYKIKARPLIDPNSNQATGEWQLVEIVSP